MALLSQKYQSPGNWTIPSSRRAVVTQAGRDPPDYSSRRRGGQEENRRRAHLGRPASGGGASAGRDERDTRDAGMRARSQKGSLFLKETRRRGRPAHMRSPDDSPFRDGNRDRLIGLLTHRAAKTLEFYFMETNLNYHHWLKEYIRQNPIPSSGSWDDVSGEMFLRRLMTQGVTEAKAQVADPMFSCVKGLGIDPRSIAHRIMEIRKALAEEFIQDLQNVAEENAILMRESAMLSLSALESVDTSDTDSERGLSHPEMLDGPITIPDTAAAFLVNAADTGLDRFAKQRAELEAAAGAPAADELVDGADSADVLRPGVDDINEFESELEAGPKWKRRFRLMKQDSSSDEDDAASGTEASAPSAGGAQASVEPTGEQAPGASTPDRVDTNNGDPGPNSEAPRDDESK